MKLRRVDASIDRQIVTGMVVSTDFCKSVHPIYKPELLMTSFAIKVADWCMGYYREYEQAPGKHIQDIFFEKQREGLDDTTSDSISQFLESLSQEYERADKFNVAYLLDQTERLFRSRSLKYLAEDIEAHLDKGELEDAEDRLGVFKKLERPKGAGINPFRDKSAFQKAFEAKREPLFLIPGALGQLLNPHLIRSGFIGFLGHAKVGKTWRVTDIAMWALRDRCKVALFQLGDLTQEDFLLRWGTYIARKSNDPRYCGELLIPVLDCLNNQRAVCENHKHGTVVVDEDGKPQDLEADLPYHKPCCKCARKKPKQFKGSVWYEKRGPVEPLDWPEGWECVQKWGKRFRALDNFRLATFFNSTLNVKGMERQLDLWEEEDGFVPDVILLDYPDIMAKEDPKLPEGREQENPRWKGLRRVSQERHALVIAPTQSNGDGYEGEVQKVKNLGEDKRKTQHTTAFFAIDQTEEEAERGIIRISSMGQSREGDLRAQVCVLQSLGAGRPYIGSFIRPPKKSKTE